VNLPSRIAALAGDGRERRITIAALAALTAISWAYLWFAPMPMPETSGGLRTAHYAALTFAMWFVMMIGMMTPSAAPTLLLYDRVQRASHVQGAGRQTACFVAGYLCVWAIFSAFATLLQIQLIDLGWIDTMAVTTRRSITAGVLLAVGVYQWLPLKRSCLDHCRSPAEFIATHRRPGATGAWLMGVHHGLHCLGCCWGLMLLLFVGGVMNLLWVAAITAVVLCEKLLTRSKWVRHAIGVGCVIAAAVIAIG
jgi:predicted metal-binding membrane protein